VITGTVTAAREAVFRLSVYDAGGQLRETDAVVDTGYDGWLTLPPNFIAALGLTWKRFGHAILADGSTILTNIYEATIEWDGQTITRPVDEADIEPLVGMSLMYVYELVMPILDGATFTLQRIATP
jgi:clan AA aspartic protease